MDDAAICTCSASTLLRSNPKSVSFSFAFSKTQYRCRHSKSYIFISSLKYSSCFLLEVNLGTSVFSNTLRCVLYCCDLFIRDFALAGENHGDQYTIDNFQSFLSVWIQAIDPAAVSKTNRKTEQIERGPRDRNGGEIAEASSCCTAPVCTVDDRA